MTFDMPLQAFTARERDYLHIFVSLAVTLRMLESWQPSELDKNREHGGLLLVLTWAVAREN